METQELIKTDNFLGRGIKSGGGKSGRGLESGAEQSGRGLKSDTEQSTRPRYFFLDWLKAVAIGAVILIHVASIGLYNVAGLEASDWLASNFYSGVFRLIIPVFFMATGFLLLPRFDESLKTFWQKRLKKIIPIWVGWQIGYWWWVNQGIIRAEGWLAGLTSFSFNLKQILFSPSYYHLWFLSALIVLYLITPPLRIFLRQAQQKDLWYVLGLWLILVVGGKILNYEAGWEVWNFNYLVEYIGYYLLGYYFYRWPIWGKKAIWWSVVLVIIAGITVVGETAVNSWRSGFFQSYSYDYLSVPVVVGAIGIFVGAQNLDDKLPGKKLLPVLASASLGIYLWHVIVIEVLRQNWLTDLLGFPLNGTWPNYWLGIPLVGLLVYALSFGLTKLCQKIPFLKHLV